MSPVVWVILGVTAALLGGGGFFWLRGRRAPKEEPVFHLNCPSCGRRLGYKARQAGRQGQCPRCRKTFTFPAIAGKTTPPRRS
jgi:predicted RNA-binding Zn-ribbon protein involved in translation (DUF1610 family)